MKQAITSAMFLLLLPLTASAQPVPPPLVPEPGVLPLLAVGGVIGLAVYIRRRKK